MHKFTVHSVGVARGSTVMFSAYQDGGTMWVGHGPRAERTAVRFDEPFLHPPLVQVSLSMWDIDQQSNQRADISAEDVTETGFTLVFKTWGDTRVARVRADWMAIGSVSNDDDWEID